MNNIAVYTVALLLQPAPRKTQKPHLIRMIDKYLGPAHA